MEPRSSKQRYTAEYWIDKLRLIRHVEGGSFCEVYRSPGMIPHAGLDKRFAGDRAFSTHIYFLLERGQFSAFHRIASDEIWHFYAGDPLHVYEIATNGHLTIHRLGTDPEKGETFQAVVKAGNWFASATADEGNYSLAGCTVAPGFDFADFTLADRGELTRAYPQHAKLIAAFTKKELG